MTPSQAECFWKEWQAFQSRWRFTVYGAIDESAYAVFAEPEDSSRIYLTDSRLQVDGLKKIDVPLNDVPEPTPPPCNPFPC